MVNIIAKKATLVNLSTNAWGVHKSNYEATEEVLSKHKAEKNSGLFRKRLLDKRATKEIRAVKNHARLFHNMQTLPWMDDGTRILPNVRYMDYTGKMKEYREGFAEAVDNFIREYPQHVKQAKKALGTLFAEEDYPAAEVVRSKYNLSVVFLPWPDKQDFRGELDQQILKEIGHTLDHRLEQVMKDSMTNIAERITEVVGHMAERLKAYNPGDKSKGVKAVGKFHDTMVEHVREITNLLPGFNLTDNPKLAAIHKTLKQRITPYEPDVIRDSAKVRMNIIKDADDILKKVQEFL